MLRHVDTVVKQTAYDFTDDEFRKLLLVTEDPTGNFTHLSRVGKRKKAAVKLYMALVVKYRWKLFKCGGYIRFHRNGYGQMRYIKVGWAIDYGDFKEYKAAYIIERILELEKNNEKS